ncbi:hypothetical protein C8R47DRAFT_1085259 [Mycena vitilis]|nr:hypothetical protein C8R47DRAFT_1085259 [Mycena vitilis]
MDRADAEQQTRVVELESYHAEASSAGDSDMETEDHIYLTMPQEVDDPMVQAAERATSNIRRVRKEIFDGVYPPARVPTTPRVVKEIPGRGERENHGKESIQAAAQPLSLPRQDSTGSLRTSSENPPKNTSKTAGSKQTPELIPIEARKVRFELPEDVEMTEAASKQRKGKQVEKGDDREPESRHASGRQSELTATVDKQRVVDRILDTKVELSLREIMSFMILSEKHADEALTTRKMEASDLRPVNVDEGSRLMRQLQQEELATFWKYAADSDESREAPPEAPEWAEEDILLSLNEEWDRFISPAQEYVGPAAVALKGIKGSDEVEGRQHLKSESALMNSSSNSLHLPTEPESAPPSLPRLPYVSPFSTAPYENIQYLSRQQFHQPPTVASMSPPHPNDALASIESVLHEQWGRYMRREPVDVLPAFTAAPQSKYIGSYTSPGGQQVHRSIAMNSLEVLTDEHTGRPYSLVGHTVRDTYAAPASENAVWPLELFYPTNERLHGAMAQCLREPPADDDSGFPVHATSTCPPLPGFADPLSTRQGNASVAQDASVSFTQRFRNEEQGLTPAETASALGLAFDAPIAPVVGTNATGDSMPSLVSIPSAEAEEPGLARLSRDVATRAVQDLSVNDSMWCALFNEGIEGKLMTLLTSGDRGPEEARVESPDIDVGICSVCFEPAHGPWRPCSPSLGQTPPYMIPGHPPTPPRLIPVSPAEEEIDEGVTFWLDEMTPLTEPDVDAKQRQMEADRAVQEALRPILEDFVNLPLIEGEALDHIAAHAREMHGAWRELITALEARATDGEAALRELKRRKRVEEAERRALDRNSRAATRDPRLLMKEGDAPVQRLPSSTASSPRVQSSPHGSDHKSPPSHLVLATVATPSRGAHAFAPESPLSEYSYEEMDLYTRRPLQPSVNEGGEISPAVTEWSVSSLDYEIQPKQIIDEAVFRVKARQAELNEHPFSTSNTTTSSRTYEGGSQDPSRERTAKEQFNELLEWKMEGARGQDEVLQWEDGVYGDPIREGLRILHGPLARYVDYASMASDSLAIFRNHTPTDIRARGLPLVAPSPPASYHSPTSLDYSLPDDARPAAGCEDSEDDYVLEPFHRGRKRERPSMTPAEIEAERRKRRRLPTGLADAEVVRMFAGVRQAFLEGFNRIEGLVWERYDVSQVRENYRYIEQNCDALQSLVAYQDDFPTGLVRHPFLCDDEAAKIQVLHNVLLFNRRNVLASLLADVLLVRLHDNYTVSQLLNAGYLDSTYPPESTNHRDLFGGDEVKSNDDSSSSVDSGRGYSPSGEESARESLNRWASKATQTAEQNEAFRAVHRLRSVGRHDNASSDRIATHGHPSGAPDYDQIMGSYLGLRLRNRVPTFYPFH